MRAFLLAVSIFLPACMFAHTITGTYAASGFDPLTDQDYTGVVVITKAGAIYTAEWTFEDSTTAVGTGVRKDDTISFVFRENFLVLGMRDILQPKIPNATFGVQVYEIEDGTLKGPWVRFEATKRGFEKLKKIHSQPV